MGSVWLRHFLGVSLTEAERRAIPNPRLEMAVHVSFKTVQVGSIVGVAIAGPLLALRGGRLTLLRVARSAARYGTLGAVGGLALGPPLSNAKTRHMELDHLKHLCYKLRMNRSQLRSDRLSLAGLGGGVAVGMLLGQSPLATGVLALCVGTLFADCLDIIEPSSQETAHYSHMEWGSTEQPDKTL